MISQAGRRLKDFPVETNGEALVEAIRMIPGQTPTTTKSTPSVRSADSARTNPLAGVDTLGGANLAGELRVLRERSQHPGLVGARLVPRPLLQPTRELDQRLRHLDSPTQSRECSEKDRSDPLAAASAWWTVPTAS